MGQDNQPKNRRDSKMARKQGRRASYDRILIVSEGSKTEPHYFGEIRSHYTLHWPKLRHLATNCETIWVRM